MATDVAFEQSPDAAESPPQDRDALYEIVDGVRVELPEMAVKSNVIKSRLHIELGQFVRDNMLGWPVTETLFILDTDGDQQRRPDVAFVSAERWPLDREVPNEGEWRIAPDLCVEVTSPNDRVEDLLEKIDDYFAAGVRQVWVVATVPRRVYVFDSPLLVHGLGADDTLDGGQILPGFKLPLAPLFA